MNKLKKTRLNESGITLIALVVSIIVMIILAGVGISSTVGESGVLTQTKKSNISQTFSIYKEEFEYNKTKQILKQTSTSGGMHSDVTFFVVGEEVKKFIPSLSDEYVGRITIFDGELVYTPEKSIAEEEEIAGQLGITTISLEDYNYMLELSYLEQAVLVHANDEVKIGTELGSESNPYEKIAGINYGLGWHKISTEDELRNLGLTDAQLEYMIHGPYIVRYATGAVQCIEGKLMYAGLDNEIWKYTFNYFGETGEFVVSNLLSGVTTDSTKDDTTYGDFTYATENAASGWTSGVIENYYVEPYTYDEDGGVVIQEKTNILSMAIDQSIEINNKFTINITFKADLLDTNQGRPSYGVIDQNGNANLGGCLLAISDYAGKDVCSVRIRNGLITVITFFPNGTPERTWKVAKSTGYVVFDATEYNNKYINLTITSERAGLTNVYINGALKETFTSGSYEYTYKTFTIGDLRSGRGMKFLGTIYNFGLYGEVLTEEEVAQNWTYIKDELSINEAGDKI